jgi:hypothetical protein
LPPNIKYNMIPYNGNGNFAVRTTLTFLLNFLLTLKVQGSHERVYFPY